MLYILSSARSRYVWLFIWFYAIAWSRLYVIIVYCRQDSSLLRRRIAVWFKLTVILTVTENVLPSVTGSNLADWNI